MDIEVDVAVVGGGIAGMSVAGELSVHAPLRVVLLEQESQLAYHSTGRSVAAFLESYGSPVIRALTRSSRPFFDAVAAGGAAGEAPLLTPRPLAWLAQADQVAVLDELLATEPALRRADEAEVRALCPAVRPGWTRAAAIEDGAQDIDVAALFDRYRRLAARHGASILTGAGVRAGRPGPRGWLLRTDAGDVRAATVVNAAGAWADHVAARCGVAAVGLTPFRRTVAIVSAAGAGGVGGVGGVARVGGVDRAWPLVADVGEGFYFRPEGDGLLVSPADETPVEAGDARAEVTDVALALDRVNEATTLDLRHVRASWAGLRTFAADRDPVVGFDPASPGFFWLAGQGGYGMQTAPAMALLAAALIRGEALPATLAGFDLGSVAPARFR